MAVPSLVQGTFNNLGSAATSIAKAYGSNVGIHSSLIWVLSWQNSATLNSIVDTLSSSSSLIKSIAGGVTGWTSNLYLITDTGASGGADTVTATFSAAVFADIQIFEYTGNPGTITQVGSAISNSGTNTSPSPGSITVSNNQQLVFTNFFGNNAASYTIANPFTVRVNDTFDASAADAQIVSGTVTPLWNAPNTTQWQSMGAAFRSTNNPSASFIWGGAETLYCDGAGIHTVQQI